MEMPRSVSPEAPWSPLGYQVVVTKEKVPGTEAAPQTGHPSEEKETTEPRVRPWAMPGYRVVEVVEEATPILTRRSSADAGAANRLPRPKARKLGRWITFAAVGSIM